MKMGYIGSFGKTDVVSGGQVGKTRNIWKLLNSRYSDIYKVDLSNWGKHPLKSLLECRRALNYGEVVFAILAKNSRKVMLPVFYRFKKKKNIKILLYVIGGCFPDFVEKDEKMRRYTKACDYVFVQTKGMIQRLNAMGVNNVVLSPSFSTREYPDSYRETYVPEDGNIYRMFTFSRICEEKGITEAIQAVRVLNESDDKRKFVLDIYGVVASEYEDEFNKLLKENEEVVKYRGAYTEDDVLTFQQYYFYLFPTHHSGEGFPTTILESMMAGVPIIASDWMYNSELVENGETGFLFGGKTGKSLEEVIEESMKNKDASTAMRRNVFEKAKEYSPEYILDSFVRCIEN